MIPQDPTQFFLIGHTQNSTISQSPQNLIAIEMPVAGFLFPSRQRSQWTRHSSFPNIPVAFLAVSFLHSSNSTSLL
jgi:hypothetical protein